MGEKFCLQFSNFEMFFGLISDEGEVIRSKLGDEQESIEQGVTFKRLKIM